MSDLPKVIDNYRRSLGEVLRAEAPAHRHLSIATGYWDLPGTLEIIDEIKDYEKVRILIGAEPYGSKRLNLQNIYENFPEEDIAGDLMALAKNEELEKLKGAEDKCTYLEKLRTTAKILAKMLTEKRLEVKICRKPFLHAKTFIFGDFDSDHAVGIIGSSNFTRGGLATVEAGGNAELNAVEDDYRIVLYRPTTEEQETGHLAWFERFWRSPEAEKWTGEFTEILRDSPVGDLALGPYDVYIKTLMECFPDELVELPDLGERMNDVLYKYQNRNAGILINKLEERKMAILADSVGLGKTITAGAVIQHYIAKTKGKARVVVIVPAALKDQWREDLTRVFGLVESEDYHLLSQQDLNAISQKSDYFRRAKAGVDLFVIDEAHNLRNEGSKRHQKILEWLQKNAESKVLMLTATPINNSLNDLVNLIKLGLKGNLASEQVIWVDSNNGRTHNIDFLEALGRIQKLKEKTQKAGKPFKWEDYRSTLVSGIRKYVVRSTRQGVEEEGLLTAHDGTPQHFPDSEVRNLNYSYPDDLAEMLASNIDAERSTMLEGVDARRLDLQGEADKTQRSRHPLDLAPRLATLKRPVRDVIPNLFQLVSLLGFAPYKFEVYQHDYYGKSIEEITEILSNCKSETVRRRVEQHLTAHNMLQVTLLKRLESSTASLLKSIEKYQERTEGFSHYLEQGYLLSFKDISALENDYGEDLGQAFADFADYQELLEKQKHGELSAEGLNAELKKRGVEKREADPKKYNIAQLKKDIERDRKICELMKRCLYRLSGKNDQKLTTFAHKMVEMVKAGGYGKKVLVFSFFADTIDYLRENLGKVLSDDDREILRCSAFLSGRQADFAPGFEPIDSGQEPKKAEDIIRLFSPKSKKYELKAGERELDFLFATDVLSEGQNLQDAAILINYDLHWNPVRMIQRNGRINRLGSGFGKVLISNLTPENNIELYLRLVARLEQKIATIKNSIGLDQGVLSDADVNPIEFVDDMKKLYSADRKTATAAMKELDKNNENDILSWTSDHVFELRKFWHNADEKTKKRLQNLPLGKWTYLPESSQFPADFALSLQKTSGHTASGRKVDQTFFTKTNLLTDIFETTVVDDQEALDFIRAEAKDNERRSDRIELDRPKVAQRANKVAERRAEAQELFQLKPSMEKAIEIMQPFCSEKPRSIIETKLRDSRHKRQFDKLVRQINKESKEDGSVNQPTITAFQTLLAELQGIENEKITTDTIKNIFFYMKG